MQGSAGQTTAIQSCLERMRLGDPAARDELFVHASRRLYRLAHKMLQGFPGVRRWEETDDVVQQAAIRLSRALSAETPTSVAHFFRLAAVQIRRELIDLSRRLYGPEGMGAHHHTGRPAGDDSTPHPYEAQANTDGPATLARWTEFHEAAKKLPSDERDVFDLHYYGDLMLKEVAEALNISERTARRRWRSAKLILFEYCDVGLT